MVGGEDLVGVGVGPAGEVEATDVGVRHAARPRLLHPGRGQAQLAGGMGKYILVKLKLLNIDINTRYSY